MRPPARHHRRHIGNAELLRPEHTAMPGDQRTLFVNEHRVGEAKFADRGSDLRYLLVAMSASISGIRDQPIDRPPLDLVGRPPPLISGSLARGRAGARQRGSVGAENLSGWLARIEACPSMKATTWDKLLERVAAAA